ncbi:MAG TPA: cytochrome c [Limnobacter sp.]|nr:cytochrome c [Limnobacter sp.]
MAQTRYALTSLVFLLFATGVLADDASILAQGRKLFQTDAEPACAICHTLADAGSKGQVGPVLDQIKPSEARVLNVLKNGKGAMPPFTDHLNEEQMKILAKYVSTVTGGHSQ